MTDAPAVDADRLAGRAPFAWAGVLVVVVAQGVVLLAMSPFYGPHRDELYFAAAGRHLAWGYPDQPPFTPLLARLAGELAPGSLMVLRLPSLLATAALVVLAARMAWLLDGPRRAQVLTAVVVAASAVVMTQGHRLTTATFDTLAWTAVLLLIGHALVDERPRLWLAAGVVAGVGLENKHAIAVLVLAVVAAVGLDRRARPVLRTPWPWAGGVVALALWLPNVIWQADHGWPARELSADIADEYGGVGGRVGLVVEALFMFSPLVGVVWVIGLMALLRGAPTSVWRTARPLGTAFVLASTVFLVTGGKGYYLAGAIVPLVAAGCVRLVASRPSWPTGRVAAVLAATAVVAWPALVPVLPASAYAESFYPALNDDQLETIGWPGYADQVRGVLAGLPPGQRRGAVVFTGNYGEAGALLWYDVGAPVFSGHNGFHAWGPPAEGAGPVVVVGAPGTTDPFESCREVGRLRNDVGADNEEAGVALSVCAGPRGGWRPAWPRLLRYDA